MDFATPQVHKNGNQLHVTHGNDEGLYVEFEKVPVQNNFESEKEGRPIFADTDYIKIIFPGDKTKQVYRPVDFVGNANVPADTVRFPKQWDAYQKSESQQDNVGTPITEWAPLTKSQAAEFKAMNIHTVESLASLPDTALSFLGARAMRDKAQIWLKSAQDGSVVMSLRSENETLKADLEMVKAQIKELSIAKDKKEKETK